MVVILSKDARGSTIALNEVKDKRKVFCCCCCETKASPRPELVCYLGENLEDEVETPFLRGCWASQEQNNYIVGRELQS